MDEPMTIGHRVVNEAARLWGVTAKEFAAKLGVSYETLRRWQTEETSPNRARVKQLAEMLNKSEAWVRFGEPPLIQGAIIDRNIPRSEIEGQTTAISSSRKIGPSFTLIPVVSFQGLDMSTKNDLPLYEGHDWMTAPGVFSPFAKIATMPDDSMFPEISRGEFVAFDPEVEADVGDTVLIGDQHGGLWIRKYRPLPGSKFDAVAVNPDHAPLRSWEDGIKVIAVMVGHWRGRRTKRH